MMNGLLTGKLKTVKDSQSQNEKSKACVLIAAIMLTVCKTAAGWAHTASICQLRTLGMAFNKWSLSGSRRIGLVSYNVLFMSKKNFFLYLYLHYICCKIWGKWGIGIIYPTKQALSVLFLDRGSFSRKTSSQRLLTLLRSPEVPASMSICQGINLAKVPEHSLLVSPSVLWSSMDKDLNRMFKWARNRKRGDCFHLSFTLQLPHPQNERDIHVYWNKSSLSLLCPAFILTPCSHHS